MRRARDGGMLLAPVAVAALAIVCCAGLPLIAGLFAGLTVAVILELATNLFNDSPSTGAR